MSNAIRSALVFLGVALIVAGLGTAVGTPDAAGESDVVWEDGPSPNASQWVPLWSGDRDVRGGGSDQAGEWNFIDRVWNSTPSLARQWNERTVAAFETDDVTAYAVGNISETSVPIDEENASRWSLAPTDATLEDGDRIRDAYVEIHSITPSVRYHRADGTETVTESSGTVRVLTDGGMAANGSNATDVVVDNVTVVDDADGTVVGRTADASAGGVSLSYSGFDAGHRGLTVRANLTATYSSASGNGTETETETETITVSDGADVVSRDRSPPSVTSRSVPDGTALDIDAGTPYWEAIDLGNGRSIRNVWNYYTAAKPGKVIVGTNGSATFEQGTARAAQVHAYPARSAPALFGGEGEIETDGGRTEGNATNGSIAETVAVSPPEGGYSPPAATVNATVAGEPPSNIDVSGPSGNTTSADVVDSGDVRRKPDLRIRELDGSDDGRRITALVTLEDPETGAGISTGGPTSGGSVAVAGRSVETNDSGMATVRLPPDVPLEATYNPGDGGGGSGSGGTDDGSGGDNLTYLSVNASNESATNFETGGGLGVIDVLTWPVQLAPAIVPLAVMLWLFDRANFIRSWPPWELLR